jgi:hypothetical protein
MSPADKAACFGWRWIEKHPFGAESDIVVKEGGSMAIRYRYFYRASVAIALNSNHLVDPLWFREDVLNFVLEHREYCF